MRSALRVASVVSSGVAGAKGLCMSGKSKKMEEPYPAGILCWHFKINIAELKLFVRKVRHARLSETGFIGRKDKHICAFCFR